MAKNLLLLVLIGALLTGGYFYLTPGASLDDLMAMIPFSHKKDDVGNAAKSPVKNAASTVKNSSPPPSRPLQPIRLKNGDTIMGRIVISDAELTIIRTGDGKTKEVRTKDIIKTP